LARLQPSVRAVET